MKYKVGDKVRVRSDLIGGHKYGGLTFLQGGSMETWRGRIGTVTKVSRDGSYFVDDEFWWSEEMLEPVTDGGLAMPFVTAKDQIDSLIDAWSKLGRASFSFMSNNKEDTHMKNVFATIDDTRIDKTCNKKVDTVTTYAWGVKGGSWTTCDKTEYDPYVGALVAAAKITANQFEEAHLMYDLAMNMWGTDTSKAILKTLANRAFGGMFENAYAKWQRQIAQTEKWTKEQSLKCKVCGKTFDTEDEARAHEQWHIDNKKARRQRYLDRKEAKKRMAEAEREKRIKAYVDAFTALGDEKKRRGI